MPNDYEGFKEMVESSQDLFWEFDESANFTYVSPSIKTLLGYEPAEVIGLNAFDLMDAEEAKRVREHFDPIAKKYLPFTHLENINRHKDGREVVIESSGTPIFDETGRFRGYRGVDRDITKRKQAENKLLESEEKFRVAFKTSPDSINLNRLSDGVFIDINDGFTLLMGYEAEEVIGRSSLNLDIWNRKADRDLLISGLLEKGYVDNLEAEFVTKSGEILVGLMSARVIEIDGEKVILSICRNITDRKQVERGMALLTFAMNHISEAVFLADDTGTFNYVNAASCKALGYSDAELLGMSVGEVDAEFPMERWPEFWKQLIEKGTIKLESSHRCKNGTSFPVAVTANYFEYNGKGYNLGMAEDISERIRNEEERHKLEEQMIQAQKLESLGVLAGGVAHDFNNLLAAIMGHAELAKRRLSLESNAQENLKQIEQAAERAADLAKQMLAYSGRGKFVVEATDLNRLLTEMLHMLEVTIPKKVILRLSPYTPLPSVNIDATQIRQLVMNLVINAAEAIGSKSGVVSISTGCIDCDEQYLKDVWLDENLADGLYVYLEVADSGCGMDRETLAKIFDPFFTTKFTGRGLGMSAVLGIVRGHNGAIKVYSEPARGTTFKILLPASGKPAEIFNGDATDDGWQGVGKVLLVDDEETVRGVGIEMLKELGFTPLTANDGQEALQIFKDNPDIVLVILDLTMPKMDGEQCFRELKMIRPDVRVLMSSGYNEFEVSQKFAGKGVAGFVQKPYKLSVLKEAIRNS